MTLNKHLVGQSHTDIHCALPLHFVLDVFLDFLVHLEDHDVETGARQQL